MLKSARLASLLVSLALVSLALVACAEPTCRAGERRVGTRCYKLASSDDASVARDSAVDESEDDEGATGTKQSTTDGSYAADGAFDSSVSDVASAEASVAESDSNTPDAAAEDGSLFSGGDAETNSDVCVARQEVCNDKDDDCDGIVDNGGAKNACGGPCSTPVVHEIGKPCSNNRLGVCAASGTYQCDGASTKCKTAYVAASSEKCDGLDNDCNGVIDDAPAGVAPTWVTVCPSGKSDPIVSCEAPSLPSPDCYNSAVL